MATVKITLVKSGIDRPSNQKKTLNALGLTKMNRSVEVEHTPQIKGMINVVKHLVTVTQN
ncbi:MAG: 50S ribosomal protein L30 [Bacteroidetes bacterium]|jgi:large subunit ribosomal protein L30|nr:50S ribosomal protein L30 [Bacteroidota bacterium]MBP6426832.1 50S ribosomal protein L30 [Bacteroidia bacterium]MBK7570233.1 50S ribosomal protein L30 [Bacteroidota bacterium]MBK8363521.1 50S ribosomal protein L30 [Bacteroidota bacterium]MBK9414710.1 50S ribosomal protein L30 [Bacteroidota bacterium]